MRLSQVHTLNNIGLQISAGTGANYLTILRYHDSAPSRNTSRNIKYSFAVSKSSLGRKWAVIWTEINTPTEQCVIIIRKFLFVLLVPEQIVPEVWLKLKYEGSHSIVINYVYWILSLL